MLLTSCRVQLETCWGEISSPDLAGLLGWGLALLRAQAEQNTTLHLCIGPLGTFLRNETYLWLLHCAQQLRPRHKSPKQKLTPQGWVSTLSCPLSSSMVPNSQQLHHLSFPIHASLPGRAHPGLAH